MLEAGTPGADIPRRPPGSLATRSRLVANANLVMLSLSVYAPTLGYGFVWDDHVLIVQNSTIRDWSNLPRIFAADFFQVSRSLEARGYHRPLVTLSYMVDHTLWGLRPFGYHLTNVLLHVTVVVLVYLVGLRLLRDGVAPLLASALFAVHPIHTESVAWIAGRTDVIATAFVLLSLLLYVERRPRRSWGALVAFAAALLAKEVALLLPAVLLVYESFFHAPPWRDRLRRVAPFLAVLVTYGFLRFGVLRVAPGNPFLWAQGPYRLLLTFAVAVWIYGEKLLLPVNLNAYYSVPVVTSLWQPFVLASLAMLGATGAVLQRIRRGEPAIVFAALVFLLALLPVSNLVPLGAPKDMGSSWPSGSSTCRPSASRLPA